MERLTERDKTGTAMAACCGSECKYNYCCEIGGFSECRGMDNIIDRLASIEDILGDEYDLDRLHDLVQADREGRVRIEEKTYQCPKCGAYRLTPRSDKEFYFCFNCKTQFTKEEVEAALRREQE